jgi:MFS family permease
MKKYNDDYEIENSVDVLLESSVITGRKKKNKITRYLIFNLSLALFGGSFQAGFNIGLFNTSYNVIKQHYNNSFIERTGHPIPDATFDYLWPITNALLPAGGTIGGLFSGKVGDHFGRKNGLVLTNIIVLICACLNIISKYIYSYETLMVSRFLSGIFCGLFNGILPVYINELSPQDLRGQFGSLFSVLFESGILVANVLGLPFIFGNDKYWPLLVGSIVVPAIAHFLLFFTDETPKYLFIKQNKIEETKKGEYSHQNFLYFSSSKKSFNIYKLKF